MSTIETLPAEINVRNGGMYLLDGELVKVRLQIKKMKTTKRCPRCKTEKVRGEFWNSYTRYDGLEVYCKECKRNKRRGTKRMSLSL